LNKSLKPTKANSSTVDPGQSQNAVAPVNQPLALKPSGFKHQLLRAVTSMFPGWRMTFIAKKANS
jgi:hypothetical protein